MKSWSQLDNDRIEEFVEKIKTKKFTTETANDIAELILPNIHDDVEHIIINPDAVLSKLAFEVLLKDGKLLTETYRISYTSNLVFVMPEINQGDFSNELAVYAPEYPESNVKLAVRSKPAFLEGAQKESELISQLFESNLYNGKQLTKQDFIDTASKHKLLHLAMHAVVDNSQSGISRLLFSDESSQTDDLYLEELYGLNLNADLAVLSACNTGVDKSNSSSDIESFQRAFTFAGVPATVASLWEVPDQPTKELMVNFYENLKKGQPKSLALKNAKYKYKKAHANTKLEQPYYWAGFVLYGEDKAVALKESYSLWYGLVILSFFIGLFFRYRKRLN